MESTFFVVSGSKEVYGYDFSLGKEQKKVLVKADNLFDAIDLASQRLNLEYYIGVEAEREDLLNLELEILE